MYYTKTFEHIKDGGKIMKNNGCSKCDETSVEGRAYIDEKTGLLCVDLQSSVIPEGKDVLIPVVCTTCGSTTWKVKSTTEEED